MMPCLWICSWTEQESESSVMPEAIQPEQRAPRPCGECSLCCKLMAIDELKKPANRWCAHVAIGKGCRIYDERPAACRSYQCVWTMMRGFDDAWRPDRAKFMMDAGESQLIICCDPAAPDAWRREPYYSRLKALSSRRARPFTLVLVRLRGRIIVVFPETEIDVGPERPELKIQSGYEMRDGRPVPFARYAASPA